jgi:hypothetical protein
MPLAYRKDKKNPRDCAEKERIRKV